ncbi:GAF domain-containing protein [Stutzerimonas urumqiensis]|uniref:GAF domain-containing protein n=1 Tax=Stutzerimonas urumqiensis TaxID=638269 RepID=UPI003BABA94F
MKFGEKRKFIYRSAEWIYLAAGVAASSTTWLVGLDGTERWLEQRTLLWAIFQKTQSFALYLYAAIAVITVTCIIIRRLGDPWVIEKIQFILDGYHGGIFSSSDPRDHHRVTLFKHHRRILRKRHWQRTTKLRFWGERKLLAEYLAPYLRSGHLTQNSKTMFYIDSDNSDRSEGVAGMAWSRREVAHIEGLPNIHETSSIRTKEKYANATKTSVKLLEKYLSEGRCPPRSIAAIPIECHGNLWGVLVLDSRDANGVTQTSIDSYKLTVALIGQLLERV